MEMGTFHPLCVSECWCIVLEYVSEFFARPPSADPPDSRLLYFDLGLTIVAPFVGHILLNYIFNFLLSPGLSMTCHVTRSTRRS